MLKILQFLFNWKTILAVGVTASGITLAAKVEPKDAGKTLEAGANAVSSAITGTGVMNKR